MDRRKGKGSTVSNVLAAARAEVGDEGGSDDGEDFHPFRQSGSSYRPSLQHPSRPFTPREPVRGLGASDIPRPSTAFSLEPSLFEMTAPLRPISRPERPLGLPLGRKTVSSSSSSSDSTSDSATQKNERPRSVEADRWIALKEALRGVPPDHTHKDAYFHWASVVQKTAYLGLSDEQMSRVSSFISKQFTKEIEPRTSLKLAHFLLRIGVSGSTQLSTVKVIYKLSKESSNDELFTDEKIIPSLFAVIELECKENTDNALFAAGAVKNVSSNAKNQNTLIEMGAVERIMDILMNIPNRGRGVPTMIQLTALLRSLASGTKKGRMLFARKDIIESFVTVMTTSAPHVDVATNCCRVLAKITHDKQTRDLLLEENVGLYDAVLRVMKLHPKNVTLMVRAGYSLGNLTTWSRVGRTLFLSAMEDNSLNYLLDQIVQRCDAFVAEAYRLDHQELEELLPDEEGKSIIQLEHSEVIDALTKLVRVLANLAIESEALKRICVDERVETLIRCLGFLSGRFTSRCVHWVEEEELLLNIIHCVSNISYDRTPENIVRRQASMLVNRLAPGLLRGDFEMMEASLTLLGNLSQEEAGKDAVVAERVDEIVSLLLDHSEEAIVLGSMGILVNVVTRADVRRGMEMREESTVLKLIEASRAFPDTKLVALQCIHNISLPIREVDESMGENHFYSFSEIEYDEALHFAHENVHTGDDGIAIVARRLVDAMSMMKA
eukprot:TRINITY_DN12132_c0_g1_i1.p1 TRINITY_DN12132_c0_g1~~TRINITY_DN12132_c0_g1_i1.p1  ORF type:complete len:736 (+),score=192.17 TRINITY_DN12132_c0_g1_i1:45-2210(+)